MATFLVKVFHLLLTPAQLCRLQPGSNLEPSIWIFFFSCVSHPGMIQMYECMYRFTSFSVSLYSSWGWNTVTKSRNQSATQTFLFLRILNFSLEPLQRSKCMYIQHPSVYILYIIMTCTVQSFKPQALKWQHYCLAKQTMWHVGLLTATNKEFIPTCINMIVMLCRKENTSPLSPCFVIKVPSTHVLTMHRNSLMWGGGLGVAGGFGDCLPNPLWCHKSSL